MDGDIEIIKNHYVFTTNHVLDDENKRFKEAIENPINKYKEQEEQIEEYKLNVKEAMHEAQENARIFRKEQENTNEYRKMIELMAYRLNEFANLGVLIDCPAEYDGVKDLRNCPRDKNCVRCIIDYFKKKAGEKND